MPLKKKLITLAKELEFSTEEEYYNYCVNSYINGQRTQCRELFRVMRSEDQKGLITYLDERCEIDFYKEIKNFYFELL